MKEISLVLFQRFIQHTLIGHLLRGQHGARCLGLQRQTKQKEPMSSQSCFWQSQSKSAPRTWQRPPERPYRMLQGHSRDHLGDWDKSRERAGFPGSNSSKRNYVQVMPHFAYKHETVQKYSNVKPFCKIIEEIIGQILPNELSKHTLRISLGLLDVHFSYMLKCFISQGRETQVT